MCFRLISPFLVVVVVVIVEFRKFYTVSFFFSRIVSKLYENLIKYEHIHSFPVSRLNHIINSKM